MTYDVQAAIAAASDKGMDMTKPTKAGSGSSTPPEGKAFARFVGYYDLGLQKDKFSRAGGNGHSHKVQMIFELSGANYQPYEDHGELTPYRVTVEEKLSNFESSNFQKMFRAMNYKKTARNMIALLGSAYKVEVIRKESTNGHTYAKLNLDKIEEPVTVDVASGTRTPCEVPPPLTDIALFDWKTATPEMWDSIYLEGEYPAKRDPKTGEPVGPAHSRNKFQNLIRQAKNWPSCKVYAYAEHGEDIKLETKAETLPPAEEEESLEDPLDKIPF